MEMFAHPLVAGMFTGILSAAAVDIAAFRSWKSHEEAMSYDWRVATWRWFQGAVVGVLSAAGMIGMTS